MEYKYTTFVTNLFSMASVRMQTRIDSNLKNEAEKILEAQGFKPAQAIHLFYTEVARIGGFPFLPSKVPTEQLKKDLDEAKKGIGVRSYKNNKDFFKTLKKFGK